MPQSLKLFTLVSALFATGALFGGADGAGLDRAVYRGLVPPAGALAPDALGETAALSGRLGLRPPQALTPGDEIAVPLGRRGAFTLYSGVRTTQRFGAESIQPFSGVHYPLSESWSTTLEASVDPALPRSIRGYGLLGQVQRSFAGGGGVTFGLQYNIYDFGASRFGATEPPYVGGYFQPSPVPGVSSGTSYELRLSYRYGERSSVGLTYGSARDFELARQMFGLYPGDGRQYGLTGQHWLTDDWAVSYGLVEKHGLHRGQGLRLGLRYRF